MGQSPCRSSCTCWSRRPCWCSCTCWSRRPCWCSCTCWSRRPCWSSCTCWCSCSGWSCWSSVDWFSRWTSFHRSPRSTSGTTRYGSCDYQSVQYSTLTMFSYRIRATNPRRFIQMTKIHLIHSFHSFMDARYHHINVNDCSSITIHTSSSYKENSLVI
jgi:hypothetical protein